MSNRARLVSTWLVVLATAAGASAQSNDVVLEPDRPDVTDSTHVVAPGMVQIEFGGQYTRATPRDISTGSPLMVRIGLADWLEARISTDGLLTQRTDESRVTGFGNVQLSTKIRLLTDAAGDPVFVILPAVNLPTADASRGLGSGDVDVSLTLITGADLGQRGRLDANYGIASIGAGQGQPHFSQHLLSATVSTALTDRWSPYIEAFWLSRTEPDTGAETSIDAGVVYAVGSRFAIDGGVQFGVAGPSPNFAAFGGFSVLLGGAPQTQSARRSGGTSTTRSRPSSRSAGNVLNPNP